jgi:NAD(P)-dependent dehydrogenase (short-subunit alcohol dehydrogenase family)
MDASCRHREPEEVEEVEVLTDRVAVITGGASGIGLAIVAALIAEGMRVVLADLNEAALHAETRRLMDSGADVYAVAADVGDPLAVEELAAATVDRYGELNVAVNNAGIVRGGTSWEGRPRTVASTFAFCARRADERSSAPW